MEFTYVVFPPWTSGIISRFSNETQHLLLATRSAKETPPILLPQRQSVPTSSRLPLILNQTRAPLHLPHSQPATSGHPPRPPVDLVDPSRQPKVPRALHSSHSDELRTFQDAQIDSLCLPQIAEQVVIDCLGCKQLLSRN